MTIRTIPSQAAIWPTLALHSLFNKVNSPTSATQPKWTEYHFWIYSTICGLTSFPTDRVIIWMMVRKWHLQLNINSEPHGWDSSYSQSIISGKHKGFQPQHKNLHRSSSDQTQHSLNKNPVSYSMQPLLWSWVICNCNCKAHVKSWDWLPTSFQSHCSTVPTNSNVSPCQNSRIFVQAQ